MADFSKAFEITMGNEGGYSNDPDDVGGETYRGISRVYHPYWEGWGLIDSMKPNIYHDMLDSMVKNFYKREYWFPNKLDDFPQKVSNEMFDTGVNLGIRRAAKFLQRALSFLNRNEKLFLDLVDDGIIGNKTFAAFSVISKNNEVDLLLKIMNVIQGNHYLEYMKKSPIQEKNARGWFKRVKI